MIQFLREDVGMGLNIYYVIFKGLLIYVLYPKNSNSHMIGLADAGYFSDPNKVQP